MSVTEPLADPAPDAAFFAALADDLNTPAAIASLHQADEMALAGGLGFLGFSNVQMKIAAKAESGRSRHRRRHRRPQAARKAKNFAESDRIRDELLAQGIVLKDGPRRHDLGDQSDEHANGFISSTPPCATGRRPRAWISRWRTSARSRWRWTAWGWITSKAAGPAPIPPTRHFSPNARR